MSRVETVAEAAEAEDRVARERKRLESKQRSRETQISILNQIVAYASRGHELIADSDDVTSEIILSELEQVNFKVDESFPQRTVTEMIEGIQEMIAYLEAYDPDVPNFKNEPSPVAGIQGEIAAMALAICDAGGAQGVNGQSFSEMHPVVQPAVIGFTKENSLMWYLLEDIGMTSTAALSVISVTALEAKFRGSHLRINFESFWNFIGILISELDAQHIPHNLLRS